MIAIFIIILVIGAIISIAFNIWNKKNPVGKDNTTVYQSLNKQYMKDKKQNEMLNEKRSAVK